MNKKRNSKTKATFLTTLLLIITLFLNVQPSQAQCHLDDWTALKALYESTDGGNWTNNSGWTLVSGDAPKSDCLLQKMHGVHLDGQGRVEKLYLWENQLSGNIPPELSSLSNLTQLFLNNNQITGSIPPELGKLTNLTMLKLSDNKIGGSIPPELGNLSILTNLLLSKNQISGSIPSEIGSLSNLVYLKLSHNRLSGNIPVELSNLDKLTELWLSYNQLSGSIPAELGNMFKLKNLYLSRNQLSGCYDVNLLNLSVGSNNSISKENYFDATWEDFRYNLDGSGACSMPDYRNCYKNDSLVLTKLIPHTDSWARILEFNLPFYVWEDVTINGFGCVTELDLSSRKLTGNIPPELGFLSDLRYLNLSNNGFGGSIPTELGNLSKLKQLLLTNNVLSGNIPPELGNLNNLLELRLYNNQLSGSIPAELGNLSNLSELWLSYNQLSGSIPAELGNLNKLTELWMQGNEFSGRIPAELGNLNKLKLLSLTGNQLVGSVPAELGRLNNLTYIKLNRNQLSGTVPPFNPNFHTLDLSNNFFDCDDINTHFVQNKVIPDFLYLPQLFTPIDYNNIQSTVIDSLSFNQPFTLNLELPETLEHDFSYLWRNHSTNSIFATNSIDYTIDNFQPNNAGKYTIEINSKNCLSDGSIIKWTSEPIYVIAKGYDLTGQPVEYTQLMVEFENQAAKDRYEQEIFLENGGIWADKCDCNRELHLYDFPKDSSNIAQAYVALDQKIKNLDSPNEIDGGFNYKLNNIGLDFQLVQAFFNETQLENSSTLNYDKNAYSVKYNYPEGTYTEDVGIYLLDSGFDENNFIAATDYLMQNAPVDSCYSLSASGYNHTKIVSNLKDHNETVDTDYTDEVGHGTFGFRSISQGLQNAPSTKIVPLKIIERATDGNLFDLICALYHAVDHNASVINISAGYRGEPSGILTNAIILAKEKEIFVVAAAGNDGLDIDNINTPQYPAFYANKYHYVYNLNAIGGVTVDTVRFNNLISVAAVNINNTLNEHSNYGKQSVSIAAPGENIYGHGLEGVDAVGTGTSIATFLTTQVLAHEIASNKSRSIEKIWTDFENRHLTYNPVLASKTSTGKQINFEWKVKDIEGCTDCSACNYFPYANIDDGSCYYCVDNSEEVISLSCPSGEYCPPCLPNLGCTDILACNYNESATIDNDSCVYDDVNCIDTIHFVSCPKNKTEVICEPGNLPPPLNLQNFATTRNAILSDQLNFQVNEQTNWYPDYTAKTYTYLFSEELGKQQTCEQTYYVANQYLQTLEINDTSAICQGDLSSDFNFGNGNYKIYADDDGAKGSELTTCETTGLYCPTSGLDLNTKAPGIYPYWVTQFFNFPNGKICESEATPFVVEIYPKPFAQLTSNTYSTATGNGIALMSLVSENTKGYWTGEHVFDVINSKGEIIPYFIANKEGSYKLYYTVENEDCQNSYLITIKVSSSSKNKKKALEKKPSAQLLDDLKPFHLYPNPARYRVQVEWIDGNRNVFRLLDLTGKVLKQRTFEGEQFSFDVSNLAKGIYLIEIENESGKSVLKLLVE